MVVRVILGKMPTKRRASKWGGPIDERPPPGTATDCPSREGAAGQKSKDGRRRHRATVKKTSTIAYQFGRQR